MYVYMLLIALMVILVMLCTKGDIVEGMSGYGTLSGLAYNSKGLYCFKNIYDPSHNPDGTPFGGYCSVIGKVVV